MADKKTKDKLVIPACNMDKEIEYLLRAKYNLMYVVTWEERRFVQSLQRVCNRPSVGISQMYIWDAALGLVDIDSRPVDEAEGIIEVEVILDHIIRKARDERMMRNEDKKTRGPVYVLCDIFRQLRDTQSNIAYIERKLKQLSRLLTLTSMHVVITGPVLELPTALEKCITVIDYPLPEREQLQTIVESAKAKIKSVPKEDLEKPAVSKIVDALLGLTLEEAKDAISKSIVKNGCFDIDTLNEIKRQTIRKGELLDYITATDTLEDVGGFAGVKEFMRMCKRSFEPEAVAYKLPPAKGIFLLGVQGTGKSLCAKAVANELQVPLLKLEIGRMFSKWLGESDYNMARALRMAESIAPCVLFIDEINMALANTNADGSGHDAAKRCASQILQWMQEKRSQVFVVACANSITGIPPALLRKGRFDELFFVDLPTVDNRKDIFNIHIRKSGRDPAGYDVNTLAERTDDFSGAEIENIVYEAMRIAYADGGREYSDDDMLLAIAHSTPLAKLDVMKEEIDKLKEQSRGRMKNANARLYPPINNFEEEIGNSFENI